jgi:hypothetical protein
VAEHLPNLLTDIRAIVDSQSQADPQFRSQHLSTRLTVGARAHAVPSGESGCPPPPRGHMPLAGHATASRYGQGTARLQCTSDRSAPGGSQHGM